MWRKWGIIECGRVVLEQCFSKDGLWNTVINLTWELVDMQIIRPHLRPIKFKKPGDGACGLISPSGDSDAC